MIQRTLMSIVFLFFVSVCSAQEEEAWSASAGVRYLNRYTSYGIDLSGDRPALSPSISLSHGSGFSAGLEGIMVTGASGGLQRWSLGLGYELSLGESFTLSAEFNHFQYRSDTAHVLAGLSNAISLSADLDLDLVSLSASVDRYLGDLGATYFGFDVSGFIGIGDWTIVPLAQITLVSQTVSVSRTKQQSGMSNVKKGSPGGTVTLTGVSSFSVHGVAIYSIASGFSLVLHPAIVYSPKTEVTARPTQFVWSAGIRYSFSF